MADRPWSPRPRRCPLQARGKSTGGTGSCVGRRPGSRRLAPDQCWTLARIAEVARGRFGVEYILAGLDPLLHRVGWRVQAPSRKATEHNEAKIAVWKDEQPPYPRCQAECSRRRLTSSLVQALSHVPPTYPALEKISKSCPVKGWLEPAAGTERDTRGTPTRGCDSLWTCRSCEFMRVVTTPSSSTTPCRTTPGVWS
ncbi:winged helix-turn-helix domain-containing protein [Streptomyces sp. NPDC056105]|uniref:helix-turn-helix domain-containing protein n=1 Tax=Streptomyces sp. NPDC056105 TaxID=3345714 RepID=UPI0035D7AEA1